MYLLWNFIIWPSGILSFIPDNGTHVKCMVHHHWVQITRITCAVYGISSMDPVNKTQMSGVSYTVTRLCEQELYVQCTEYRHTKYTLRGTSSIGQVDDNHIYIGRNTVSRNL